MAVILSLCMTSFNFFLIKAQTAAMVASVRSLGGSVIRGKLK